MSFNLIYIYYTHIRPDCFRIFLSIHSMGLATKMTSLGLDDVGGKCLGTSRRSQVFGLLGPNLINQPEKKRKFMDIVTDVYNYVCLICG